MIPRTIANKFAYLAGVDLHLAQQEVVLLYALDLLRERGILDGLVFKGGSYLRKMVLGDAGRVSEDLDFTANGLPREPEREIRDAFSKPHHSVTFEIDDPHPTSRGNWACTVAYSHEWDDGQFQLEVSFREKVFLSAESRRPVAQGYFGSLPFEPPAIPCMRLEEALAEKLRAVQQRTSERDLYDIIRYSQKGFRKELVRLLAFGKLWNVREEFDPNRVLQVLKIGRKEWPELDRLVGKARRWDWNAECKQAAARFEFLHTATQFERELAKDCRRHRLADSMRARIRSME